MIKARPWIDPVLQARFREIHGPRAERAEARFLLVSALAVLEGHRRRRERAEDALAAALEAAEGARREESEWASLVHGLALGYAQRLDATRNKGRETEYVEVTQVYDEAEEGADPAR